MAGLLSIFGLDNPRLNPEFDPSKPGNIPQLQVNEKGEVIGVNIPQNVQRYQKPGLLRQLAGDPSNQRNVQYANDMQALAFGMYDKAKQLELAKKLEVAKLQEENRLKGELSKQESEQRTAEELARQRAAYAFAHGMNPENLIDPTVAANMLQFGQLTTGNAITDAETAGLKARATKELYSDTDFGSRAARLSATYPFNLATGAYNPLDNVSYRVGGVFPTTEKSMTIGPNGMPIQTEKTSGVPFQGGTFFDGKLVIGPERSGAFASPKKAISKTEEVDTNAQQAAPVLNPYKQKLTLNTPFSGPPLPRSETPGLLKSLFMPRYETVPMETPLSNDPAMFPINLQYLR